MNDRVRADDVDALQRQLRAQIGERRRLQPVVDVLDADAVADAAADADEPPAAALAADLRRATQLAGVGAALPSFAHLHPLRRAVARTTGRALLYLLRLITVDQQQFNHVVVRVLKELRADLAGLAAGDAALDQRLAQVGTDLASARTTDRAASEARAAALGREIDAVRSDLGAARAELTASRAELDAVLAGALAGRDAQLAGLAQTQSAHAQQLAGLHEASERLRTQADVLRRRVAAVGEAPPAGARSAALAPVSMPATPTDDGEASVDTWLVSQAFRGTEEALGDRQRQYVTHFEGRRDVLDIGCGRGEFLLLLREAGVSARGVDSDRDMALWCQEKGLDVTCTDALTYLAHQPEASLGGIFCAQVVEHLATPDLLRFVHLAHRALRPDGLLLIETLNPESLLVLYRWFWVDLTHERLVHPETLKFVMQSCGFRDVDVHFVPPPDGPLRLPVLELPGAPPDTLARFNAATQYLNELLYGSFDYAVMGIR